jgi:hypothetical protein
MIQSRNDNQATYVRPSNSGLVRYRIGLWSLDKAAMSSQVGDARLIAAAQVTATLKRIPELLDRATTGVLVPTAASDDAREVTP